MQFQFRSVVGSVACALVVGACGLPLSGPRGEAIEREATVTIGSAEQQSKPYCLVKVNEAVVDVAQRHRPRLTGSFNAPRRKTGARIGVGDVVSVTLFEASAGGLFFPAEGGSRQGNFLPLPNQTVDDAGNISVPYAGSIRAAGRTVVDIQRAIVDALKGRALEPQAVVTVVDRRADLISVLGEVGLPVRFAASASGERMIDALARAGGIKTAGSESWVLHERAGRVQVVPFEAIIREPTNNIAIYPQDNIYVFREPQTFLAFGATGNRGQFPFDAWRLTLSEALAKSGGLVDTQAEPAWVFLYRLERAEVIEELGTGCRIDPSRVSPVIYQVDLRNPSGMFLASQFPMRNKDVIYVANARTVEETKFFRHVQELNLTAQSVMGTAISGYTLRNLARGTGTSTVVVNP